MRTFAEVLAAQLRRQPARPLITYYDEQSGERTELSLTTYANWVAKAAGLLAEEADLERGQEVRIDLPVHWMGPIFLGAAWTVGASVSFGPPDADQPTPAVVVCGPAGVQAWAEAGGATVFACSLSPLGQRFPTPLPPEVRDVGVEIWSQPDAFTPWDPPTGDDEAVRPGHTEHGAPITQHALMQAAAAGTLLTDGGRLLSTANPASPPGMAVFTEPLARSGSLVLLRHADPEHLARVAKDERITHQA